MTSPAVWLNEQKALPDFLRGWQAAAYLGVTSYPPVTTGNLMIAGFFGILGFSAFLLGLDFVFPPNRVNKKTKSGLIRTTAANFAKIVTRLNKKNKRFKPGIKIHPLVQLPLDAETEHICVIGSTGSGKTLGHLNSIYCEAEQRGDKIILFDVKGDFTAALAGRPEVTLMAPWDSRSANWDLQSEITQTNDCDSIAESIIPVDKKDAKNESFRQQARQVLSATLKCLYFDNSLTWENLKQCLLNRDLLVGFNSEEGDHVDGLLERYEVGLSAIPAITGGSGDGMGGQTQANWSIYHGDPWKGGCRRFKSLGRSM